MSFFGIGPMELIFILIIMVLVLGPKNMVISAKKMGITLRKIVKSPLWATVMDTSREIREIPTRLIREAGIEEDMKGIKTATDSIRDVGNISVPYDLTKSSEIKKEPVSVVKNTETENFSEEEPSQKVSSESVGVNHVADEVQVNEEKTKEEKID
ncbi:MAG: hypothetical protein Q7U53_12950 [Anaerolineaceae bacterium]|nr:hypothetical protein [Anaerolineaceae bacterium]